MPSLPIQRTLYPLLFPLGLAYAAIMAKRRASYTSGAKERFSPAVPCVAVGNIGWGGSGKTPIVDWLLGWAKKENVSPVVLTRGYKAEPPSLPYVVTADSTPQQAGDEPCMLAKQHPQAHIVVDPVRKRSGAWAQEELQPDLFVLDDGFQHLAVKRNVDLVLLKPEDLEQEWNRVIPSGSWRESKQALTAASAILIKCSAERFAELTPLIEKRLGNLGIPVFSFSLTPTECIPVTHTPPNKSLEGAALCDDGTPYILFSGVGEPAQVAETASNFLGRAPLEQHTFPDHHAFTADDIKRIAKPGIPLLCTPKDAVKLPHLPDIPIWTFTLQTTFGPALYADTSFPAWWNTTWRALRASA